MSYMQTILDDNNRDRVYDISVRKFVKTDATGKINYQVIETDAGNDGVIDTRTTNQFGYDDLGRQNWQWDTTDNYADGTWDSESYRHIEYDAYGRVLTDRLESPDMDGDNIADYSQTMTCTYDANGNITAKETLYYNNGQQSMFDYRLETFSYNSNGLLYEHYTDDWAFFDFVVGRQHHYDSAGRLTKIKVMDPFVFGDETFHNEATFRYNSKGQMTESNHYNEFMNGTHVLEVKTKFTYDSAARVVKELATGQDWNWKTVERQLTEHWYDANGRETTTLISFDENLDGRWDAGTRTLTKTAYDAEGDIMSQTIDYNAGDGFSEHVFTVEPFDGLIV